MSHCPQFKHWDQKWLLLWIFLSQHLASIRSAPSIPGRSHICVKRTGCPATNTCRRIDTCCPLFTYSRNGHWNDLTLYACKCGMKKGHGLSQKGYHISIYPKVGSAISEMTTLHWKFTKNNAIQSKYLIHSQFLQQNWTTLLYVITNICNFRKVQLYF